MLKRLKRLWKRRAPVVLTPSHWMTLGDDTQACRIATCGRCRIYMAFGPNSRHYLTVLPGRADYRRHPTREQAVAAAQRAA